MKKYFAIIISSTLICCSSENNNSSYHDDDSYTNFQKITVNTRNVQQSRGALLRAQYDADIDLVNARKEYVLSALSRATGSTRNWKSNDIDNGMCSRVELNVVRSSGTLTSDSRYIGAAHSLIGATTSGVPSGPPLVQDNEIYRISFDGYVPNVPFSPIGASGIAQFLVSESGLFIDDDSAFDSIYTGGYGTPKEDVIGFSSVVEESPLLAYRLWSLGLEAWTDFKVRDERSRLRASWPFEVDANSGGDHFDDIESQNLLTLGTSDWKGHDLVILKARIHDHLFVSNNSNDLGYLESGDFTLNRPSMFFNQINVQAGQTNNSYPVKASTALHLLHSRSWPLDETYQSGDTTLAHLISYPGYRHLNYVDTAFYQQGDPATRDYRNILGPSHIACRENSNDFFFLRSHADSLFFHTLDSGPMSSGGTILSEYEETITIAGRGTFEFKSPWLFDGYGAHTSAGRTESGSNYGGWEPSQRSPESDPYDFDGKSPWSIERRAVLVGTWFNDIAVNLSKRDHPGEGTPDNPLPDKGSAKNPSSISYPSTSDDYYANIDGRGWSAFKKNRSPNPPRTLFEPNVEHWNKYLNWANTSTNGDNPPEMPVQGQAFNDYYEIEFHCDSNSPGEFRDLPYSGPGYLAGVTGTRSYTGGFEGLSLFGNVCAPWSDLAWSDNWKFLAVTTTFWNESVKHKLKNLWSGHLYDALRRVFVIEPRPNRPDPLVKPMPLKMCPPNYAVGQLKLEINEDADIPYVMGISALQCHPVNETPPINSSGTRQLTVYMNPGSKQDGYTIDGEVFSLRQDIGIVEPAQYSSKVESVWVGCDPSQSIASLAVQVLQNVSTDLDGFAIGVNPGCRNLPQN